ncbi:hypothetical protein NEIPOLOT_00295 [Neisseria polysaccharea ATCC 43768]|nr:hypothetical protein NEIPOLOT_00295 [Neisseria polysaccharea ATCC 43768]
MISSVYKGKPLISVWVEIYLGVLHDNGCLAQKRHFVPDENEEDMSFTFRQPPDPNRLSEIVGQLLP